MKSGLEDRNNHPHQQQSFPRDCVSMKSGLEDRNNPSPTFSHITPPRTVSMKSGLEDRNNMMARIPARYQHLVSQ